MDSYFVSLTLRIKKREDGSFVATCDELPILLAARDMAGLKEKVREAEASVERFLAGMSASERAAYWDERGIKPSRIRSPQDEISMPVLVVA